METTLYRYMPEDQVYTYYYYCCDDDQSTMECYKVKGDKLVRCDDVSYECKELMEMVKVTEEEEKNFEKRRLECNSYRVLYLVDGCLTFKKVDEYLFSYDRETCGETESVVYNKEKFESIRDEYNKRTEYKFKDMEELEGYMKSWEGIFDKVLVDIIIEVIGIENIEETTIKVKYLTEDVYNAQAIEFVDTYSCSVKKLEVDRVALKLYKVLKEYNRLEEYWECF